MGKLPLPVPTLALSPPQQQTEYVGVPIWLSDASSQSVSASETATNGVATGTVTATARVTETDWSMGDPASPSPVVCHGPGTPYDPGRYPASASSPDCGYEYEDTSAGQPGDVFTGRVHVVYTVTWTGSGAYAGRTGTLSTSRDSAPFPVSVGELQSVTVSNG